MNKKLLSLVLALVMVFSVFTTLFAEEETEATAASEEYIEFLKEHGLIKGDAKGDLMLDKQIDRASFAALLVRADDKEATAEAVKSLGSRFKDMTPAHWANGYANVASEQGWMKGNEKGEFMPSKTISYAEICTTLVRFLKVDDAGFTYPVSYIAKAHELGLTEGLEHVKQFDQPAVRKDIFRMIYNAISKEDFGRYTVYKMIVLENNRVAQLAANEIKTEVLSVVQVPNKVGATRFKIAKVGEQFKFNLEKVKMDPEFLLGKVANFSVDEKGNLVKVVVDDSYDYLWGGFKASEKNFAIAGRNYGVRVDERYYTTNTDDRMFRTYVTAGSRASNYHYLDFIKGIEDKKINANLARVTAKDGMIIFIDTFQLNDIAPVKEVAREGQEVYYYNDARDGAVERMTPARRIIGYTEKDGFHVMNAKDIKANDTIHWMSGFTLVRRDAELKGELKKTFVDRNGEFALIGEDAYFLNSKVDQDHPFVSVYAYDDKNYRHVQHRGNIEDMRGDEVVALLDVFGDIQLITSHRSYSESVALIDDVISSWGISYHAPNKEENYKLADNFQARYWDGSSWNNTHARRIDAFNHADLVYVQSHSEDQIAYTARIMPFWAERPDRGYSERMEPAKFEKNYARFLTVGTKNYRFGEDTDVFAYNTNEHNHIFLKKLDMADVIDYNMKNGDLKAWVFTEKEFKDFVEGTLLHKTYNRLSDRNDYARIIIFTDVKGPGLNLGQGGFGRVARIFNYSNQVVLETSRGNFETFTIADSKFKFTDDLLGKFVEFRRVKDTEEGKEEAAFLQVLPMECVKVTAKYSDRIVVEGGKTYFLDRHTQEFGNSRFEYAMIYRFDTKSEYIEVIDYVEACYVDTTITAVCRLDAANFLAAVEAFSDPVTATQAAAARTAYEKICAGMKADAKVKEAFAKLEAAEKALAEKEKENNEYIALLSKYAKDKDVTKGMKADFKVTDANYVAVKADIIEAEALESLMAAKGVTPNASAQAVLASVRLEMFKYEKKVFDAAKADAWNEVKDAYNAVYVKWVAAGNPVNPQSTALNTAKTNFDGLAFGLGDDLSATLSTLNDFKAALEKAIENLDKVL